MQGSMQCSMRSPRAVGGVIVALLFGCTAPDPQGTAGTDATTTPGIVGPRCDDDGVGADCDEDGVPAELDRCPEERPTGRALADGCSLVDLIQRPERWLAAPRRQIRTALDRLPSGRAWSGARDPLEGVLAAVDLLRSGAARCRSGPASTCTPTTSCPTEPARADHSYSISFTWMPSRLMR